MNKLFTAIAISLVLSIGVTTAITTTTYANKDSGQLKQTLQYMNTRVPAAKLIKTFIKEHVQAALVQAASNAD